MQPTLPGIDLSLEALTQDAIKLLRVCQPKDKPYYGCFSGGKDSTVIKELGRLAGINVIWHYNVTTIDPPELVQFIREHHPDVDWRWPDRGFFTWFRTQGFPTRKQRWCCRLLKEQDAPVGSTMIFGVRAEESSRRAKNWGLVTYHDKKRANVISPIVNWTSEHVWAFIREHNLPYCCLYDQGFDRLGCVGCPQGSTKQRLAQFARWPKYLRAWRNAFRALWGKRAGTLNRNGLDWIGNRYFASWEEMWDWWLNDEPLPSEKHDCQGMLELFL